MPTNTPGTEILYLQFRIIGFGGMSRSSGSSSHEVIQVGRRIIESLHVGRCSPLPPPLPIAVAEVVLPNWPVR